MKSNLGSRILELLEAEGMSQKELARRIGSSNGTVCRYISGSRKPHQEMLLRIAQAFNVSVDYLLGEDAPDRICDYETLERILKASVPQLNYEEKEKLMRCLRDIPVRQKPMRPSGGRRRPG